MEFDHVMILVEDLEKAIEFYVQTCDCERPQSPYPLKVNDSVNEYRFAMLRTGGAYIELMELRRGPFADMLKKKSIGSIYEVCFRVEDIEKFYDKMKKNGITLVGENGKPIVEKKYRQLKGGNKFAYLPYEMTLGTVVEVIERLPR